MREMVQALFDHPLPWVASAWLLASLAGCWGYLHYAGKHVGDSIASLALIFFLTGLAVTLPIPLLRKAVSSAEGLLENYNWNWKTALAVVWLAFSVGFIVGLVIYEHAPFSRGGGFLVSCSIVALYLLSYLLCRLLLWLRDVARNPVPWFLPGWLLGSAVVSGACIYACRTHHQGIERTAQILLLVLVVTALATVCALQWLRLALHRQG